MMGACPNLFDACTNGASALQHHKAFVSFGSNEAEFFCVSPDNGHLPDSWDGSALAYPDDREIGKLSPAGAAKSQAVAYSRVLEHDPEKWLPVFRKDHAQTKR
jgi:hypothetical protein